MRKILLCVCILAVGIFALPFLVYGTQGRGDIAAPTSPSPANAPAGMPATQAEMPVVFQWSSVQFPGSASVSAGYLLDLYQFDSSGKPIYYWVSAPNNFYTYTGDLVVNTIRSWRVRACLGSGPPSSSVNQEAECGPWSNNGNAWQFTPTLKKPTLLLPGNTIADPILSPVVLKWDFVTGADAYDVVFKDATTGSTFTPPFRVPKMFSPEKSVDTIFNHSYQWSVIPVQGGNSGPESDKWSFFVSLPKPSPSSSVQNASFPHPLDKFSWISVTGASSYVLEVFASLGGSIKEGKTTDIFFPNYTKTPIPPRPLFGSEVIGQEYTWRVSACQTADFSNCGPPGGPWKFTLVYDKPAIVFPAQENQEIVILSSIAWNTPLSPPMPPPLPNEPIVPEFSVIKYSYEIRKGSQTILSGTKDAPRIDSGVSIPITIVLTSGEYILKVNACTPEGKGCSAWSERTFIVPDTIKPRIDSFGVTPSAPAWVNIANPNVTISWTVSDSGGSHLDYVNIWRTLYDATDLNNDGKRCDDTNKEDCVWEKLGNNVLAPANSDGPWLSSITGTPLNGTYWYGMHVVDKKNNETTETQAGFSPIKVQADKTFPIIKQFTGFVSSTTVTLEYEVSDAQSGLKEVQLWRKESKISTWGNSAYKTQSAFGPTAKGTFTDTVDFNKTYDYGLHVIDQAGNKITETQAGQQVLKPAQVPGRGDIAAPTSPSPSDTMPVTSADMPVILGWSAVSFPGGPSVLRGYVIEFSGENITQAKSWANKNSSLVSASLLVGKIYNWRVRGCLGSVVPATLQAEDEQCGPWSNNGNFWRFTPTLKKPTLLLPQNTLEEPVRFLSLNWEKVTGADKYRVVLNDITVTSTKTHDTTQTELPRSGQTFPFTTVPNHSYQWKVTPMQGTNVGSESATWSFFVGVLTSISPVNRPPVAQDDTREIPENTSVIITLPVSDPDNDPLTVSISSNPSSGTVVVNQDKTVTYTPRPNFNGTDSFQYAVSDGNSGTATAKVTITVVPVNDAPLAVNDIVQRVQYQQSMRIDVLANDSDPDGDTIVIDTNSNGTAGANITITPDKKALVYSLSSQNAESTKTDTFVYSTRDRDDSSGKLSNSATVTVNVVPPGTPGVCGEYCARLGENPPPIPPANTTCICNPLTTIKFTDVIDRILNILFFVAIAVAPVMIIVAGFKFLTGGGNPEMLTGARQMLIWTGVGFGIILLSKGIVMILRSIIGF